jgi:hypothetical protein
MPPKVSDLVRDKVKGRLVDLCRDVAHLEEEGSWPTESVFNEVAVELYPLCQGISRFDVRNVLENEIRMQAVRYVIQQADDLNSKPLTAYQFDVLKALHDTRNSTAELVNISRKVHGKDYLGHCMSLGRTLRDLVKRNLIGSRVHGDGPHAAIVYFLTRDGKRCFNA